jgi:hypothetical protein
MQLEGTLNLERTRVQRWVPIVAIVVPVFLCVAMTTWFIRVFIAPPMARFPAPTAVAAAPPEQPRRPLPQSVQRENVPAPPATAFAEPESPARLPMFASFALAPPAISLLTAPPASGSRDPIDIPSPAQADDPDHAPAAQSEAPREASAIPPQDVSAGTETVVAALDDSKPLASLPLAGPIPLPPERRPAFTLQAGGPVPLPRTRPSAETPPVEAEIERRIFSAHGAE